MQLSTRTEISAKHLFCSSEEHLSIFFTAYLTEKKNPWCFKYLIFKFIHYLVLMFHFQVKQLINLELHIYNKTEGNQLWIQHASRKDRITILSFQLLFTIALLKMIQLTFVCGTS